MDSRLFIPLLLAGAVGLACESRAHSEPVATAARAANAPRPAVQRATAEPSDTHDAAAPHDKRSKSGKSDKSDKTDKPASPEIKSAFAVSAAPNALHFALNVTNPGKKGIELTFPSGQQYDFTVHDAAGREVYRWGKGRMFTQSLQNQMLDGGETKRFEERASTTLPRGTYVAIATLRSSNYPVQERVAFQLR